MHRKVNYRYTISSQQTLQLWDSLFDYSAAELAERFALAERTVVKMRGRAKQGDTRYIKRLRWYVKNRDRILAILDREAGWDTILRRVDNAQELFTTAAAIRSFLQTILGRENVDIPPQNGEKRPAGWLRAAYKRDLAMWRKRMREKRSAI